MLLLVIVLLICLATALLYQGRGFLAWTLPGAGLLAWLGFDGSSPTLLWILGAAFATSLALFGVPALRRRLVTRHVLRALRPMFPAMSSTERTALEAGTIWWGAELFSGRPNWKRLLDEDGPGLSAREQAFLENEVEEVCRMVDNDAVDETGDLSPEVWDYLKEKGFMGIIIPEAHGGLGFSPEANSAIVTKVSSHNITLAVTVMVPNSLGPAELLLHYGTDAQKKHWLPRLASGEEVPAFALTEPHAGSDASSIRSEGVVCKGTWEGEEVVGIRLNWDKRYITLAPVATLLGLAFKLRDPDGLLGDEPDLGITCALVPAHLEGVQTGDRHDPLGVKFVNGPTRGHDVFVPLEAIIGGPEMAGQGWRMLMDCLSAGRSLSLPGLACGSARVACRAMSAYAMVREQFGMPIGRFEGIEEPLARIAGMTWLMNATRTVTAGAVAAGEKPSVVSAIVKAYLTEGMRSVINDAMDIHGGAGISRGPRNVLSRMYQAIPIGITVEGANILTRTLIIFGQGAIRCHPYAFDEMEAARTGDLVAFDRAFFKHVGFVFTNITRAKLLAWTGGRIASSPVAGAAGDALRTLTRLSSAFALTTDVAMATLGGDLKRKERLTGRLADALAWMYMGSTAVKRYLAGGQLETDKPFLLWSCALAAHNAEQALLGFIANMPNRAAAFALRAAIFPFGKRSAAPSDALSSELARLALEDDSVRDRLAEGIFVPPSETAPLGRLEAARRAILDGKPLQSKLRTAVREGKLDKSAAKDLERAVAEGILSQAEADALRAIDEKRNDAIAVDAFDPDGYRARCGS